MVEDMMKTLNITEDMAEDLKQRRQFMSRPTPGVENDNISLLSSKFTIFISLITPHNKQADKQFGLQHIVTFKSFDSTDCFETNCIS